MPMSSQRETLTDNFGLCIVGFASASHDSCKGAAWERPTPGL